MHLVDIILRKLEVFLKELLPEDGKLPLDHLNNTELHRSHALLPLENSLENLLTLLNDRSHGHTSIPLVLELLILFTTGFSVSLDFFLVFGLGMLVEVGWLKALKIQNVPLGHVKVFVIEVDLDAKMVVIYFGLSVFF
jgi:hypothetical protein